MYFYTSESIQELKQILIEEWALLASTTTESFCPEYREAIQATMQLREVKFSHPLQSA